MIDNIVTGASGFIGQHLMKKLDGKTVPIEHGQMWYHDCRRLFFLSTYGNMASHTNIQEMIHANIEDVIWWLKSDLVKGWFCYMSSSSVTLPVQTPYSRTKRAAEEILQALPELKSCIVRPFSVVGIGEQKEHLIPTLIRSCMEGEEMPFNPEPVHDFIDVEDVVDSLVCMAETKATGIYELGWGFPVDNKHVKEMVEIATGKEANTVDVVSKIRPYDNYDWYCNVFNRPFKPKKSLSQSITEMVEAYKRERG